MQASRCLFHNCYALTHFSYHMFSKLLFLPRRGAQFWKTSSSIFYRKIHFFDPQSASKPAFIFIFFALIALLAVPIAIFSLLEPIRILQTAHDLCTFSLQSPVSKNDCMQHTYIFVNFVAIDATLHQNFRLQGQSFIFLMLELTFRLTFSQNHASRCCRKHIFAKQFLALPSKPIIVLPPKRPHKESFLSFMLAPVTFLVVLIAVCSLRGPFEKGLCLDSRAHFASRAPSAATIACITPASLRFSYAVYGFRCIFIALYTFFWLKLLTFCKKRSPPSAASIVLKAAEMRNRENTAVRALRLIESAPVLPHLLHPELFNKYKPVPSEPIKSCHRRIVMRICTKHAGFKVTLSWF